MSDDVTRVTKVRPAGGHVLHIRFAGHRRERSVDMTGLIARSAHFAPLMLDAESFARAASWKTASGWLGLSRQNGGDWMFRRQHYGASPRSRSR